MATVTTLENVPMDFLDFHSVKVFTFYQKYYYFLFSIYFLSFIECNCTIDGSVNVNCDNTGKCSCKTGFDGVKCNTCANNFFGFPQCQGIQFLPKVLLLSVFISFLCFIECKCDGDGSLDGKCDDAGKCSCKPGFDGKKCTACANGFFGFPQCQGIFFFNFT